MIVENIRSIEDYDAKSVGDAPLRDDWRIVCGWYSSILQGKEFKYTKEQIVALAKKILGEILRRKKERKDFHWTHTGEGSEAGEELYRICVRELGLSEEDKELLEEVRKKVTGERLGKFLEFLFTKFPNVGEKDLCPGEGCLETVMFVDSNPSKEDVKSQSPFTGPEGALLEGMLGLARLRRDEVYLTYLVKEYVGEVEKVGKETLSKWFEVLREEVKLVKPRVIVAMGDFATKQLFGDGDVNKYRLKAIQTGDFVLVCCRSPKVLVKEIQEQALAYDEMLFLRKVVFVCLPRKMDEEFFGASLGDEGLEGLEFPEVVWIPKFLSVSGGVVYGKDREPNDLDLVARVKLTPDRREMYIDVDEAIDIKLRRIMESRFPGKFMHWDPCTYGPNWKFLPIYDLVLRPIRPLSFEEVIEPEFEREFYKSEKQRGEPGMPKERQREAQQSLKENKIKMFRFFYPFKTELSAVEAYRVGEKYNVDQVIEYIKKYAQRLKKDFVPFFAQKKYDGNRIIVFKGGEKVLVLTDDGHDVTARLPGCVEELKEIKHPENFICDAELERWKGKVHLPREETTGYLHAKTPPGDDGVVINVFDCLYFEDTGMGSHDLNLKAGDIHKDTQWNRVQYLELIPFKQSTISYPDLKYHFNLSPSFFVKDYKSIEGVLNKLANSPYSEGAMIKWAEMDFPLTGSGTQWLKYKKYAEIHAIVYGKTETKTPGVFNYDVALSFTSQDKVDEKYVVEVKGKKYLSIGRLFNSKEEIPIGGIVTVKFHTINKYEHPDGSYYLHIYEPRFYEYREEQTEPDNVRRAIAIGEDSGLLEIKPLEKRYVEMAADPFLVYPEEGKTYRYVVQRHWRGKGSHLDLRLEMNDHLIGFTISDLIEGKVKEPVLTLQQAKEIAKQDISKIDWDTGKFKPREVRGGTIRPANLRSFQKAKEPKEWLTVEGVAPIGTPGSTKEYPGVFLIVDKGEVEFGAQKPYFHEYFLNGGKLKGRLAFRLLEATKESEKVLPSGKLPEGVVREDLYWVCMQPLDQTPYVLSKDAVDKGWLPPYGISCLPEKVKKQVPERLRFWLEKEKKEALEKRKELSEFEELDVEVKKRSFPFVLQHHWWKGQVVIRFGPSTEHWDLRIDVGKPNLLHFVCQNNPVETDSVACYPKPCKDKGSMEMGSGKEPQELKPGTEYNPTKDTPAFIKVIDKGSCNVFEDSEFFKKVEFKGESLKGLWVLYPEEPGGKIWLMERSEGPSAKEVDKSMRDFYKVDRKKRLVTGPVLIPGVADTQGDIIDEDEVERAAHRYLASVLGSSKEPKDYLDVMHMDPTHKTELVESWVSPIDFDIGKHRVKKGTWLVTVRVIDDEVWKQIEEGFLKGYSIQASMESVPYKPKPEEIGG